MTRIFSFGGGVQSTAALVLQAQGRINYDVFVFCNVGDDSENPDTLRYVNKISKPFAEDNHIPFMEIRREANNHETLYQRVVRDRTGIRIPAYMPNGAPGNRWCTYEYKIAQVRKFAGRKGNHVVGLGISLDEYQRMRTSDHKRFYFEYPLIEQKITRAECHRIIQLAGLPIAPKSSCWFCPFHKKSTWMRMRAEQPDLFQKAIEFEKLIINKRYSVGRDEAYLTSTGKPLDLAIPDNMMLPLIETEDTCESGYCMT